MILVYNGTTPQPLVLPGDKYYITHKSDGLDVLTMIVPGKVIEPIGNADLSIFQDGKTHKIHINTESVVETRDNRYIVKNIEKYGSGHEYVIDCEVDISDFHLKYYTEYKATTDLYNLVRALTGAKWTATFGNEALDRQDRRTIMNADCTPLEDVGGFDVLQTACEIWNVWPIFNAKSRYITFRDPGAMTNSNHTTIYTDESALEVTGYTKNSTDSVSRLYAYGKRDDATGEYLNFADINSGKEYVEISTSRRIISKGWIDERYTTKLSLLNAARRKLEELSKPVIEYQVTVKDLDFKPYIFKKVRVALRMTYRHFEMQVAEWVEHPERPELDTVLLLNVIRKE